MILQTDVLIDLFTGVKKAPDNHIVCDCIFCGKKGHMYVNKGVSKVYVKELGKYVTLHHAFDCKKCKEKGSINKLLYKLGKESLIEGEKATELKMYNIGLIELGQEDKDEIIEPRDVKMPVCSRRVKYGDGSKYDRYLRERKFTKEDYDLYEPSYTEHKRKLENFIIIKVFNDFKLKGYVARYILKKGDKGFDPDEKRYRNAESADFGKLLFGYDELSKSTTDLILVEGLFDKASVNTELRLHTQEEWKCCATFGNKITPHQMELIKRYPNIKRIWLMHDVRDSVEIMKQSGLKLNEEWDTKICYLDNGDAGESNASQILKSLETAEGAYEFLYNKVQT